MTQVSDDLLPNNSPLAFQEPEEQKTERNKAKAEALKAMPVIEAEATRLRERIAFRNGNAAITVDLSKEPAQHQREMYGNQQVIKYLVEELQELEEKIEDYKTM